MAIIVQKFGGNAGAHHVRALVLCIGVAAAIAKKTCNGVKRAGPQRGAQYIECSHFLHVSFVIPGDLGWVGAPGTGFRVWQAVMEC